MRIRIIKWSRKMNIQSVFGLMKQSLLLVAKPWLSRVETEISS